MLAVAGCSSDSDKKGEADSPAVPSAKASALVAPAKYTKLPDACKAISSTSIANLVPKAKDKGGTAGQSSDLNTRGSCSWNGLDDKGVKGSEYRWLDVSFTRYDSDATLGTGDKRAGQYFTQEINNAQGADGATGTKAAPATGIGDQSTTVTYSLKKTGVNFAYAVVVARAQNVVVTLTYNGAGYAGAKSPNSADLMKGAVAAAKETVAAVTGTAGQAPKAEGSPKAAGSPKA